MEAQLEKKTTKELIFDKISKVKKPDYNKRNHLYFIWGGIKIEKIGVNYSVHDVGSENYTKIKSRIILKLIYENLELFIHNKIPCGED